MCNKIGSYSFILSLKTDSDKFDLSKASSYSSSVSESDESPELAES